MDSHVQTLSEENRSEAITSFLFGRIGPYGRLSHYIQATYQDEAIQIINVALNEIFLLGKDGENMLSERNKKFINQLVTVQDVKSTWSILT